jgi:hypothetical protein
MTEIHAESLLHAHQVWVVDEVEEDGKRKRQKSFTGPKAQRLAGLFARQLGQKLKCNVVIED